MTSAAQSQALAIASQAQTSSSMQVSALHQEAAEVSLSARALVRQNTFTKDSLEVSPEATARPVSTEGSQARLVSQAWNSEEGQVRLVGGKIVRSQQQQHEASVTSTSSPKVVRKQSSEQTMVATTEEW